MNFTAPDTLSDSLFAALEKYRRDDDLGSLLDCIAQHTANATADELLNAASRFADVPEVSIPLYERIVSVRPNDAQAMVVLANADWLTGRGPEGVGELA